MSVVELNVHQNIDARSKNIPAVRNIYLLQFMPIAVAFVDLHR